ncbi:MAG: D-cysteine desulfhydrase family protein [Anaerolineales bacterium]
MVTPMADGGLLSGLPRQRLAQLPTPLHLLPRLSAALGGPELWVKRDDLTGLGGGGNKVRKLELLLADARQHGAQTIVTTGAPQSNHARQTAAAAAHCGLRCVLALSGASAGRDEGNLLLDRLFGAEVRWCGDRPAATVMQEVLAEEASVGRVAYLIPAGGSTAVGAAAYAAALAELLQQAAMSGVTFSHIVLASGSGGTQAGLVAGAVACSFTGAILGISVGASAEALAPLVHELAALTAGLLRVRSGVPAQRVLVDDRWAAPGYGVVTAAEREALLLLARSEGLLLDPVYTARAMAALIAMVRQGELKSGERVLFWHTGGAPALPAYADALLSPGLPSSAA